MPNPKRCQEGQHQVMNAALYNPYTILPTFGQCGTGIQHLPNCEGLETARRKLRDASGRAGVSVPTAFTIHLFQEAHRQR
eukprot:3533590-Amphidinium_carterae.1